MKVLIACEFSGIVRDAFVKRGHDAWSCDLLPTEKPGNHIQDDVLKHLNDGWDLMIAHPPCTYLTVSGARWMYNKDGCINKDREKKQEEALEFVKNLLNAPVEKIALENPIGIISTRIRKPDQIIQPYYFGDKAPKATCLWLKNLPLLFHNSKSDLFNDKITHCDKGEIVITSTGKKFSRWYWETSKRRGEERRKERSRTFKGIAEAMANTWG